MSGVIDPGAIPIPGVKPEELETAAQAIKTGGEQIARLGHDISSDWQGLSQFYRAPEAAQLFAKIHPVATDGDTLKEPTKTVRDALTTFAETAKSLVADLNGLKTHATKFRQKIAGDDDWHKDEDKVNEHNNLNNDIMTKLVAYQAAERDCANKITALFGGTHFIGTDPTSKGHLTKRGEQAYGLDHAIKDVETPWAKPQKYDAPWYEDVWNGGKDFAVGLAQDLSSLVGMYGEQGWGWHGWDGLTKNWVGISDGLWGLVGFYGPKGWGWHGWSNLGNNWLNLVNAFVPYREWDGGRGAGYVITQSILNIGSCFVGAGIVKGVFKGLTATRGAEFAEAASGASKAGVVGRAFLDGFKDAFKPPKLSDFKLPRVSQLKEAFDNATKNIKAKINDLRGINKTLDDARKLNPTNPTDTGTPGTHPPDEQPVPVGGGDHPDIGDTDHHHGGTDDGGPGHTTDPHGDHPNGDHSGGDHPGGDHPNGDHPGDGHPAHPNDGHTGPHGDHDPAGGDHTTDPGDGHHNPGGHHDPGGGHTPHPRDGFPSNDAGERYGDTRLGHVFRHLPPRLQNAVLWYTRQSFPNRFLRPGGWSQLNDALREAWRSTGPGWDLFEMNGGRAPTLGDIAHAMSRTDLTPNQRSIVHDIMNSASPGKRLEWWLEYPRVGARGFYAQYFGKFPTVADVAHRIHELDQALNNPLPDDVRVERGLHDLNFMDGFDPARPQALVGKIQTEHGYMSTSLGKEPALVDGKPWENVVHLNVPAGTRGMWMGKMSRFPEQRELILSRGIRYRITRIVANGHGGYDVFADVLPPA